MTLNYKFSPEWSLNYLFIYDPTLPTIANQSEIVQAIDDLTFSQGNIALKPSVWHRNRVYLRYSKKKFFGEIWASYSRTVNPIYADYRYISDPSSPYHDKFMSRTVNGDRTDHVNLELDLGVQELFNHLSLYATVGWNRYGFKGFGDIKPDKRVYAYLWGQLYFGNWTISSYFYLKPMYSLTGNVLSKENRWNTVAVHYRLKNWYFRCEITNPFTKRGATYENITLSPTHPEEFKTYIKDNANMVYLSVTYRFNFGKQLKKASRTLYNKGIDTGFKAN